MRICLVGNGPRASEYNPSVEIDACDLVVRLNACGPSYMRGFVGSKTDILIARSGVDSYGKKMLRTNVIPSMVIEQLKELWVIGFDKFDTPNTAFGPYRDKFLLDNIVQCFISFDYWYSRLPDVLQIVDEWPTIGAIAVSLLLWRYPEADICLAGFSYLDRVSPDVVTHNWDKEIEWVMSHRRIVEKW